MSGTLQDLLKKRPSEVDFLNGFVAGEAEPVADSAVVDGGIRVSDVRIRYCIARGAWFTVDGSATTMGGESAWHCRYAILRARSART